MRTISVIKLLTVFAIAFSLASLTGPMSGNFHLPNVQLANASLPRCQTHTDSNACAEYWYPGGPAMNTELATIYTDETAEFNAIQSSPSPIDLTDWLLPNSLLNTFTSQPQFLITAAQGSIGYYEVEFHLDNSFWGCGFNFGNSACGIQIRQAISHLVDKTSFTANEAAIAGHAAPIDNPLPTTIGGGLLEPNPCAWDASFPETGSQCIVGETGGVAYHLQASGTGANGITWIYAPGTPDLNAAASHLATALNDIGCTSVGFNSGTSVLTNLSTCPSVTSNPPTFFIRNDNVPRLELGNSMAQEICYLFTGSYAACPADFKTVPGPITAFPGFVTGTTSVQQLWWMYTAAFGGGTFYDSSLYLAYNSRFVSGIPSIQSPTGPCDPNSVPTAGAGNYEYICDPTFDSLSNQMEFAPCLSAQGDPVLGATSNLPTSPGSGFCSGTTLSSHSAGIQAENEYGSKAFTFPIMETTDQYGYLNNGWLQVANNAQYGLGNYFTWLNAWNNAPVIPGTIRQGFKQQVKDPNPYIASEVWDLYIYGNVYDSLFASDPLAPSQIFNWMTISEFQTCATGTSTPCSITSLGYNPAPNTQASYRFTLRPDVYFQDGNAVTAYDVAFSYLSLVGSGAFQSGGAADMTGVTVLSPFQFDLGVNSLGPFTLPNLTGLTIQPGRYWTNAGTSAWDSAITCKNTGTCGKSQYTLTGPTAVCDTTRNPSFSCASFPASLMTINPNDVTATFDPIANHIFVGSGAWTCGQVSTSGSGTCTSSGTMIVPPGGSWTLTRFGAGVPTITQSNTYFRASSNTALWTWSEQGGASSFTNFVSLEHCYQVAVNLSGSCAHWQQGIGNPGTGSTVTASQVTIGVRFFGLSWVNGGPPALPYDWATNPPTGISPFAPVLYEGSTTLSPASLVGCPNGYDC